MSDNKIICIGNRLVPGDDAGLAVYDLLKTYKLPDDIQIIEGGLAGLNLLPLLEEGGRIIFVDAVIGFTAAGKMIVLDQETIIDQESQGYGHHAGLPYLLSILPHVCEGDLPEMVLLIGLEGDCTQETLHQAADLSVSLATASTCLADIGEWNG